MSKIGNQTKHQKGWLNRTALGAGLTSTLGDFSYETATVILPGLLSVLGIPAALGTIERTADAIASLTKFISGYIAEKLGHRKLIVLLEYGFTPLGQSLIALSFGWTLLALGRFISWFGKGLREPLRDAIVVQSINSESRGKAFGFHRAMDTVGAIVGPLLEVILLGWAQALSRDNPTGPFRFVLALSIIPGILAVISFLVVVKDPEQSAN